jgi:hypothetical protein
VSYASYPIVGSTPSSSLDVGMSPGRKQRPILEDEVPPWVSASKKLHAALQNEEVVSWIWEFSYIYSTSGFGLEDVRTTEHDVRRAQQRLPEICVPVSYLHYPLS